MESTRSTTPLLSIVIPCFNSADTIGGCLASIFASGLETVEVLVVDDGSTDDLERVVLESARDRPVRLIGQAQSGVSVARNTGVAASLGDYVMFVDADDRVIPSSLSDFLQFAHLSGGDICVSDFVMADGSDQRVRRNINSDRRSYDATDRTVLQQLCMVSVGFGGERDVGLLGGPWAKIYTRRFLDDTFPDGALFTPGVTRSQDVLFNVEAFGRAELVTYFPSPTYVYALSSVSHSHRSTADYTERVGRLLAHLEDLLRREHWDQLGLALSRLRLIYFDEGVRRLGHCATRRNVAALAREEPFASLARTPFEHLHFAARIKVALLRLRLYGCYGLMTRGLITYRDLRQRLDRAGRRGSRRHESRSHQPVHDPSGWDRA